MTGRELSLALFGCLVAFAPIFGCSQPEKPKELQQLERILKAEGADEVAEYPNAAQYYRKSRKLRRSALDAYEEGGIERARHYAVRGKIAYQTAEAWREAVKNKEAFKKANAKIKETNPKVENLEAERSKLRQKVQELRQAVNRLEQERAEERRARLQEQQEKEGKSKVQQRKLEAEQKIQQALTAKQEAIAVQANEFAKGTFNKAENQLKSARAMVESSPADAKSTAESAVESFQAARDEAKPKYKEAQKSPMERVSSLEEKLNFDFGAQNIEDAQRGVKLILPGMFRKGGSTVAGSGQSDLETIAKLAQEFERFEIRIEGFTRKGDPTENLTISQNRARAVRDFLKNQGVSTDRMETNGRGQSNVRYPDDPAKNDRVEITFQVKRQ